MKGKRYAKKKKKTKNNIILAILIIIFICTLSLIIYWLKSNYGLTQIENEVISNVITTNKKEDGQQGEIKVDFKKLNEISNDAKAWIYIKDTDINYPVLQASDNEYYLKHDIYKKYSSCGSIFLDCNNKVDFSDDNTIIYGHNLKNQKMFADLNKIYNGDLGKNIEVEIYTEKNLKKYQIISAYMEKPDLKMIKKNFNEEEKNNFIKENIEKSKIKFNYNLDKTNNLLALLTCDTTGRKRIVITAIEENNF